VPQPTDGLEAHILASLEQAVVCTNAQGCILLANRGAEQLYGYASAELQGKDVGQVLFPADEKPHTKGILETLRRGTSYSGASLCVDRTQRRFPVRISGTCLFGPGGSVTGLVLLIRETSAERRYEADLRRLNNLESLGELAGGIAHDFNNILSGVIGSLSLVDALTEPLPEAREAALEALFAAQQARGLANKLLTFSQGGTPLRRPEALCALVEDCTQMAVRGSSVRPVYKMAADLPLVSIDRRQIEQALLNIQRNAVQVMPKGGTLAVAVATAQITPTDPLPLEAGPYIAVSIEDEGPGIAAEVRGRIFDPYFTTKREGKGLGLAIAHSIIDKHGGHILVDEAAGGGARFVLYLPAFLPMTQKDELTQKEATLRDEAQDGAARGSIRVLLIEDDALVSRTFMRLLRHLGYEAIAAEEGGLGLALFEGAQREGLPFDVVISDLTIPGGKGALEIIEDLRRLSPSTPVILTSGYASPEAMERYSKKGFADVLAKPAGRQELTEALSRALAQRNKSPV